MNFTLSVQAQDDLRSLLEHIAKDNLDAAHRVRDAIISTCSLLAKNPYLAQEIEDLSITGVRRFPVRQFKRYIVFYRVNQHLDEIEIIRLGFGGRDWENIIKEA